MKAVERLKRWAGRLKVETYALYLANRDLRVPRCARGCLRRARRRVRVQPDRLGPDLIPVLGYLDVLILVPLGITLAVRMYPPPKSSPNTRRRPASFGEGR